MSKFLLSFFLLTLPFLAFAQQPLYLDDSQPIERRIDDAMSRMTLQEKINILHAQSKFSSRGVPRLGFPDFWTDDGPHGVRPDVLWDEWEQAGQTNDSCVAFPALTCLAATWNPSLAWHYGRSLGEEARYRGKDMILGPGVNILRTPLGGRNFEYMGEDPWLVSTMVVPYIRGLQSNGVAACVKHFALNNDEENRHQVNVKVSDRALHEIYLPAFHAAVTKGGAWGLMGAYNLYRDEHNCHNEYLLKDLLKGQWGFDGVVVSDWGGCHDTDQAVNNGLDMEFGSWTDGLHTGASNAYDNYYLANAYRDGLLSGKYSMQTLNDKVRRVLRLFFRTTMARRGHGALCSDAHYQTVRRIADEGIVLLQNRGDVLPLDLSRRPTVLVVGENAIKMMTVGGGSSSLKAQREISPLDGLKARLKDVATVEYERGYVGDTTGAYNGVTTGQNLTDTRSRQQLIADAVAKARKADYVIVVGGLNKSDYQDCEGHDRKEYGLPYGQDELVEALTKANRRVVFVNISGNPVAMPWHDRVAAIVQGWYGGSESGEALADVLTGDVCPSGKLPFTWPVKLQDVGAHALKTYPGTWRDGHKIIDETYSEGVYVGYRWTEAKHIRPLFAFGHGLGYTSFKLSDLRLSSSSLTAADSLTVTVNVRNTGHRAGAETVQLYIHDDKCSVDRPVKELKGFAKVALQPGESKDVKIVIGRDALSFYDEKQGAWTAEPGTFTALVGNASDNIVLKRSFILK
ncbi:glycoside hydrolase family 3 C-terminal domain-containing protein [Hallella absiana]|uniref:glycoside hydrolase family 3 C-terminal domain-containing protein n=1 Tax=Hallella absiana TaxID=2925336 RepID=UPI0021C5D8BB|nr:glycoside hydrolase family 3 C-terminal domain-containing protein [Hallella absiana]